MMKISIKILEVKLGNSILDNSKWSKISDNIAKKIHISKRVRLSLKGVIVNKPSYPNCDISDIGQICIIPKYTKKRIYNFLGNRKEIEPPRHLVQLSISKSGLDSLEIETRLNSLKIKWTQSLLNPDNAVGKQLMLYQLN